MTKTASTFECQVEVNGVTYSLFAELDIISKSLNTRYEHFGCRGVRSEAFHEIEVTGWSAMDAGGHEVLDKDLKRRLNDELIAQIDANRENILAKVI